MNIKKGYFALTTLLLLAGSLFSITVHSYDNREDWPSMDDEGGMPNRVYDEMIREDLGRPGHDRFNIKLQDIANDPWIRGFDEYYGKWRDYLTGRVDRSDLIDLVTGNYLPSNYEYQWLWKGSKLSNLSSSAHERDIKDPTFNPNHEILFFSGDECNGQVVGSARGRKLMTHLPYGKFEGDTNPIEDDTYFDGHPPHGAYREEHKGSFSSGIYVTQGKTDVGITGEYIAGSDVNGEKIHTNWAPAQLINDDARSMLINLKHMKPGTRIFLGDRPLAVWEDIPGEVAAFLADQFSFTSPEDVGAAAIKTAGKAILKKLKNITPPISPTTVATLVVQGLTTGALALIPDYGARVTQLNADILRGYFGISQSYSEYFSYSTRIEKETIDDFTVVEILKPMDKTVCVVAPQLTNNFEGEYLRVSHAQDNGLLGKISTVIVTEKEHELTPPDIIAYEGNGCTQNMKGMFNSRNRYEKLKLNCKNVEDCNNDEIRSVRIMPWAKPGVRIYLNNSPEGGGEGRAMIQYWKPSVSQTRFASHFPILNPIEDLRFAHLMGDGSMCFGSLEVPYADWYWEARAFRSSLKFRKTAMLLHDGGRLDGKVSSISIRPALSTNLLKDLSFK